MEIGTLIESEIINKVEEIRNQKKDFALFKVVNGKVIHVNSFPETEEDVKAFTDDREREKGWKTRVYSKLLEKLKSEKDPLFVVLDFRYILDTRKCTKLFFVGWCPEKASVKNKMIFSGTYKSFAEKINITKRFTAHVPADVSYEEFLEKAERI